MLPWERQVEQGKGIGWVREEQFAALNGMAGSTSLGRRDTCHF